MSEVSQRSAVVRAWLGLAEEVVGAVQEVYRERAIGLAVFGSVANGTATTTSDLDLLLWIDPLPDGRGARMAEFSAVDALLEKAVDRAVAGGVSGDLSPILKNEAELRYGGPFMLDCATEGIVLWEREGRLTAMLQEWRERIARAGARKVRCGGYDVWDWKPDYRWGDRVVI